MKKPRLRAQFTEQVNGRDEFQTQVMSLCPGPYPVYTAVPHTKGQNSQRSWTKMLKPAAAAMSELMHGNDQSDLNSLEM